LYVVTQGCKWRDLPGDFPAWQTVYTYFRNWRKDGTWKALHTRYEHGHAQRRDGQKVLPK
jgi:putative transposase